METGALIIGVIIGYFIGHRMGWHQAIAEIEDEEEYPSETHYKNEETDEIISSNDIIDIVIEQENNCLYVYNFHTNEFMAQGKTKTDIENALVHRYPTKLFNASVENLESIGL